jgi:2,3-dihydroxyphenylpropionate 1,2-dioxygenase
MVPVSSIALCCMSHSPLLNLPGPSPELLGDIDAVLGEARDFVRAFDPELVVIFSPDHYNGFFYRLMPPFCIGTAAAGVGDYGTPTGPLTVPEDIASDCASALWEAGVDVAISASMDVDHGTVQPLQALFGDIGAVPVIPIFINSVATPLGPIKRVRALGAAVGDFLATLGKRVLVVGSGGLSHDPPVPTLATAPPAALGRIVHGEPMTQDQRSARQAAVMAAAHDFAHGDSPLRPLNPDWDRALLELLDTNRVAEVDGWSNSWIAAEAGNSAHEVRTWIAAFAALAAQGPYETKQRYYRAAPELIAGFAVRTAVSVMGAGATSGGVL